MEFAYMISDVLNLLKKDLGQPVQELVRELKVNRTLLAECLKALVSRGCAKSKRVGPAKICFKRTGEG
jgi:DNA-binding IclR family transcriptional regulator